MLRNEASQANVTLPDAYFVVLPPPPQEVNAIVADTAIIANILRVFIVNQNSKLNLITSGHIWIYSLELAISTPETINDKQHAAYPTKPFEIA